MFWGIGVLGLKPWGRKLAIVCGGAWAGLNVITLFSGFSLFNLGFAFYGGLLVWLFCKPRKPTTTHRFEYTSPACQTQAGV